MFSRLLNGFTVGDLALMPLRGWLDRAPARSEHYRAHAATLTDATLEQWLPELVLQGVPDPDSGAHVPVPPREIELGLRAHFLREHYVPTPTVSNEDDFTKAYEQWRAHALPQDLTDPEGLTPQQQKLLGTVLRDDVVAVGACDPFMQKALDLLEKVCSADPQLAALFLDGRGYHEQLFDGVPVIPAALAKGLAEARIPANDGKGTLTEETLELLWDNIARRMKPLPEELRESTRSGAPVSHYIRNSMGEETLHPDLSEMKRIIYLNGGHEIRDGNDVRTHNPTAIRNASLNLDNVEAAAGKDIERLEQAKYLYTQQSLLQLYRLRDNRKVEDPELAACMDALATEEQRALQQIKARFSEENFAAVALLGGAQLTADTLVKQAMSTLFVAYQAMPQDERITLAGNFTNVQTPEDLLERFNALEAEKHGEMVSPDRRQAIERQQAVLDAMYTCIEGTAHALGVDPQDIDRRKLEYLHAFRDPFIDPQSGFGFQTPEYLRPDQLLPLPTNTEWLRGLSRIAAKVSPDEHAELQRAVHAAGDLDALRTNLAAYQERYQAQGALLAPVCEALQKGCEDFFDKQTRNVIQQHTPEVLLPLNDPARREALQGVMVCRRSFETGPNMASNFHSLVVCNRELQFAMEELAAGRRDILADEVLFNKLPHTSRADAQARLDGAAIQSKELPEGLVMLRPTTLECWARETETGFSWAGLKNLGSRIATEYHLHQGTADGKQYAIAYSPGVSPLLDALATPEEKAQNYIMLGKGGNKAVREAALGSWTTMSVNPATYTLTAGMAHYNGQNTQVPAATGTGTVSPAGAFITIENGGQIREVKMNVQTAGIFMQKIGPKEWAGKKVDPAALAIPYKPKESPWLDALLAEEKEQHPHLQELGVHVGRRCLILTPKEHPLLMEVIKEHWEEMSGGVTNHLLWPTIAAMRGETVVPSNPDADTPAGGIARQLVYTESTLDTYDGIVGALCGVPIPEPATTGKSSQAPYQVLVHTHNVAYGKTLNDIQGKVKGYVKKALHGHSEVTTNEDVTKQVEQLRTNPEPASRVHRVTNIGALAAHMEQHVEAVHRRQPIIVETTVPRIGDHAGQPTGMNIVMHVPRNTPEPAAHTQATQRVQELLGHDWRLERGGGITLPDQGGTHDARRFRLLPAAADDPATMPDPHQVLGAAVAAVRRNPLHQDVYFRAVPDPVDTLQPSELPRHDPNKVGYRQPVQGHRIRNAAPEPEEVRALLQEDINRLLGVRKQEEARGFFDRALAATQKAI